MDSEDLGVLLDSVILIDHFNGIDEATTYLKTVADRAVISVISRAEVLTGFGEEDISNVRRLLDHYPILSIDVAAADLAANLRRKHGWKLPDALQAALAQYRGLKLATRNTRDFPEQRHDFLVVPYQL